MFAGKNITKCQEKAIVFLVTQLQVCEIRWKVIFFGGVAFFATWHQVGFCGASTPGKGNDMIHGKFFYPNFFMTVMTDAGGFFLLPPSGFF